MPINILPPEVREQLGLQMTEHRNERLQNRLSGGIVQYAHEPSDIDDAILLVRERQPEQFLKQLGDIAAYSLQDILGLIHIYTLLYPDSITKLQTRDYEQQHKKEFVPEAFIQDLSLFERASDILLEHLNRTWPLTLAANANELLSIQLNQSTALKMFADPTRQEAAQALLKYAEARHINVQQEITDTTPKNPAIEFLVRYVYRMQTEEILTVYFERLLGLELLKHFYNDRKLDVYANSYKSVALPINQDPFLRELNLFIDETLADRDIFNSYDSGSILDGRGDKQMFTEPFHNYDPIAPKVADIPEYLQQKMILQAFNQCTVVSESLLPYALAIGHQNQVLKYNTTVPQRFRILAPSARLPFEPVLDPLNYNNVGAIKKYLGECITGLIEGFSVRAP